MGVYIERVRVWRDVKFEWGREKECLINNFNLEIQKVFGKYEKKHSKLRKPMY